MTPNSKMATKDTRSAKAREKSSFGQQDIDLMQASELWTRPEPDARQTQLSREEIAHKAIALADAEGIEALSMRKLADALGVGTMTLYSYIRNKDELLLLLSDVVIGKAILPKEKMSDDWRESLIRIALHTRTVMQSHSWFFDIQDDTGPTPNSIKHFDRSLQAVDMLNISLAEKADIVSAVYNHIFGYCSADRHAWKNKSQSECVHNYIARLLESGEYPAIEKASSKEGVFAAFEEIQKAKHDPQRFERNLRRLLNGFDF